jgi:hypothetical protein
MNHNTSYPPGGDITTVIAATLEDPPPLLLLRAETATLDSVHDVFGNLADEPAGEKCCVVPMIRFA